MYNQTINNLRSRYTQMLVVVKYDVPIYGQGSENKGADQVQPGGTTAIQRHAGFRRVHDARKSWRERPVTDARQRGQAIVIKILRLVAGISCRVCDQSHTGRPV